MLLRWHINYASLSSKASAQSPCTTWPTGEIAKSTLQNWQLLINEP
ncbi:hypothetical protein RBSH_03527 [Rhodopirellula baltica SH28]|uniref:Uncharacterized protein n=1 Tax=Rhodopirellula baltica SH28 TaxID=993517 RepID=K5DFA2_RHOBT|nr:hypothetical protein RBSH_03527 [Rhodopirellula baltica SH28]